MMPLGAAAQVHQPNNTSSVNPPGSAALNPSGATNKSSSNLVRILTSNVFINVYKHLSETELYIKIHPCGSLKSSFVRKIQSKW